MPVHTKSPCVGCAASAWQMLAAPHDRAVEMCCLCRGNHRSTRAHGAAYTLLEHRKEHVIFLCLCQSFCLGSLNLCRAWIGSWRISLVGLHEQRLLFWGVGTGGESTILLSRLSWRWKYSAVLGLMSREEPIAQEAAHLQEWCTSRLSPISPSIY